VLALLVLNVSRVTYVETIVEELWGAEPPTATMATIQTYIYQLRRLLLAHEGGIADPIETRSQGYLLRAEPDQVDADRFETLVNRSRTCLDDAPEKSVALLDEAYSLWQGPALADVPHGPVLTRAVVRLDELRMNALELGIEARLRIGRHRELVSELKSLVLAHPFNELLHGHLMRALAMCGRRHEALAVYQQVRARLRDELGFEPSNDLRRIHRDILDGAELANTM
jgi:DNA-binding SARP family transcriptional activator